LPFVGAKMLRKLKSKIVEIVSMKFPKIVDKGDKIVGADIARQATKGNAWNSLKFKNVICEIEKLPNDFIDYADCSEIAKRLHKAAGGAGEIYRIKGAKPYSRINVPGDKGVYYHEVYTFGEYLFDPTVSRIPLKMGEYFKQIKKSNINIEVIFERIK